MAQLIRIGPGSLLAAILFLPILVLIIFFIPILIIGILIVFGVFAMAALVISKVKGLTGKKIKKVPNQWEAASNRC